jgi:glycosyltransferase involved in cell wall biosynthesis
MADALGGGSGVGAVAGRNLAFLRRWAGAGRCSALLLGDEEKAVDDSTTVLRSGLRDRAPLRYAAVLSGRMGGVTRRFEREFAVALRREEPVLVWIDMGEYASLIPLARRLAPHARIALFCHNVERDYFATQAKPGPGGLKERFLARAAARLERLGASNADLVIHLHRADAERFSELYGRASAGCLPVSFDASESVGRAGFKAPFERYFLFVGTLFQPNYQGMRWFVREVLPSVPGNLVIAGKGFERVAAEFEGERCRVLGFVEELEPLYRGADFIVAPIFSGGGMKVKTAEALSRGKTVVGTPEALRGYEVTEGREALVRSDARGFIEAIRGLYEGPGKAPGLLGHNAASRELFEKNHSTEAVYAAFETIIKAQAGE